jgi:site-specific DNA-methyltransferase (adenine-specific)
MNASVLYPSASMTNPALYHGDCIDLLKRFPENAVDLIVTDPPYIVNYRSRDGRGIINDDSDAWLKPAFEQLYRVLKPDSMCISFYGWNMIDRFMTEWKNAGFTPVGHIVFQKRYTSNSRFLKYQHESAFLLAKGRPPIPQHPMPDVQPWTYTGNRLHPTEKPVPVLTQLIQSFSRPGDIVLDPFMGSGSTIAAAQSIGRRSIGIELDRQYFDIAAKRTLPSSMPEPTSVPPVHAPSVPTASTPSLFLNHAV